MLAIIGGTGLYQLDGVEVIETHNINTPFGATSAPIIQAKYRQQTFFFLPRHGANHQHLPHEINYRANILALKTLGVRQIIGVSATGSLRAEIQPGEFAIASQYFDFVKDNRIRTFFGEGLVAHISSARPTCPDLSNWIAKTASDLNIPLHMGKTYACVDGPRLGTKAESHFLRTAGCDLVGMTNVPEVFLAREAQLNYATISIVTDYDSWMEDPAQHATLASIMARYADSLQTVQKLLLTLLERDLPPVDENYRQSLKDAVLTSEANIPQNKRTLLAVLQR